MRRIWGLNLQPRYVPWLGLKPTTFCYIGRCSKQLSDRPGQGHSLFLILMSNPSEITINTCKLPIDRDFLNLTMDIYKTYSKHQTFRWNAECLAQNLEIKLGFLLKAHLFTIRLNNEKKEQNTYKNWKTDIINKQI